MSRPTAAVDKILADQFAATGSDDFDKPEVWRRTHPLTPFTQGTPDQLLEVGMRAIEDFDLSDDEKEAARERVRKAVDTLR